MITTDGVYNGLTLTFNREHNGYFGAIVSGLAGDVNLNLPQQPQGGNGGYKGEVSNGVSGIAGGDTGLMN